MNRGDALSLGDLFAILALAGGVVIFTAAVGVTALTLFRFV